MEKSGSGNEGSGDGGTDEDGKFTVTPVRFSTNSRYHVYENGNSDKKKYADGSGSASKKLMDRISFYEKVWSRNNNNDSSLSEESSKSNEDLKKSAGGVGRYKNIYKIIYTRVYHFGSR